MLAINYALFRSRSILVFYDLLLFIDKKNYINAWLWLLGNPALC